MPGRQAGFARTARHGQAARAAQAGLLDQGECGLRDDVNLLVVFGLHIPMKGEGIFTNSSVRLKVEQDQLLSGVGLFWPRAIGLQGA